MKRPIEYAAFIMALFLASGWMTVAVCEELPDNGANSVTEKWAKYYDGPGKTADYAHAVAVDNVGNVYVTGSSMGSANEEDYATVKYDTKGKQLWVQRYNGPGNSADRAWAIAVDNAGNVYVTGKSTGPGAGYDYATVKYDTKGKQLWVQRYNGPAEEDNGAWAIAVDNAGGVYVTGYSMGADTGYDYATVKYDSNGKQLWVQRYNGPGNSDDVATSIKVDASRNVYVTGFSLGKGTGCDYATVKYDMKGKQLWVARYDGSVKRNDRGRAVGVDNSGNVYVTGFSEGSGTGFDYATVKYDSKGKQLWVQRYDGPAKSDDVPPVGAMAVDNTGNVYVTGYSMSSGSKWDFATIKYDTKGKQLWVQRYSGPGASSARAGGIAVDKTGSSYVIGYVTGVPAGESPYCATVKYDKDGNSTWEQHHTGLFGTDPNGGAPMAITLDRLGNVYVTGSSAEADDKYDYVTIMYKQ